MTVADNTSRNQYTATSGQTVFAYTFEIVDKDDIVVLKNGTTLSEGTDYTVSGVGTDSGGNVTLTVGASTNDVLTLYRDMPYARTQNYTNSGDFLASDVNSDFDNLWLAGEQTNRAFEQSVRKPITDSDSVSMELPEASSRANKLLGFDATGAVSTSLVTDDAETIAGIAADIETLAHIQDGTVATDAITNVNTIRTDVTAVSGVASDVTAVAGNTTNINTVATDLTGADDIGTVAGSIANVDTVAGDIANVNSVAGNSTNINTVATDLAGDDDIGTVADGITYVKTTALNINDVTTTANNSANISTVASNISNVNAVGGVSSDVTTVAGISTEVTAVSSNATNINTVGTNITNVNNVGSNIANVNTVAGLETEINAVVADEADIGVVGANITSVNTVSSNINSVNAVSNNMADVNNAAANATAAAASAADANTSAGAAATSANAASSSASNASSSESAALTSANNASQSAATASLNASAAATSATNASSSAANAATSESNADNSETAAAISASNASSSASTASNNAISAASSATSASNSASQAASSASAAATSATNSETAADTWNSYYSTYLGASATAPSYDLLGQPLQDGALYFNTTDDTMYVFNGSIWIAAESTINIVSVPTQLAADLTTNGNDIIFGDNDKAIFGAGSDLQIYHDGSNSFVTDEGNGSLYLRGSSQVRVETPAGENMAIFNDNGAVSLRYNNAKKFETTSTGIDVTGTVTADGLTVDGAIAFTDSGSSNRNVLYLDNSNNVVLATGTTAGTRGIDLYTNNSKSLSVAEGGDISFYEDTGTTPKLFWDASTERLGLGTTSPQGKVNIVRANSGVTRADEAQELVLEHPYNVGMSLLGADGRIAFGDSVDNDAGLIRYTHSNDNMMFIAAGGERLRITTTGIDVTGTVTADSLTVNSGASNLVATFQSTDAGAGVDFTDSAGTMRIENNNGAFRLYGNTTTYPRVISAETNGDISFYEDTGTTAKFFWDASAERLGLGTSSPSYLLSLEQASPTLQLKTTNTSGTNTILFSDSTSNFVGNIKYNHSNNSLSFATTNSSSERMRIDSSGNVEIGTQATGTASSKQLLTLVNPYGNTGGAARLWLSGTNATTRGAYIEAEAQNSANNHDLIFATSAVSAAPTEAMRIDSSGNLLVGKTGTSVADTGVQWLPNGNSAITRSGGIALFLNRTSSDGSIVDFRKDNTSVGSIGTASGQLGVNSQGTRLNLQLSGTTKAYVRSGSLNPSGDGTFDLGESSERFKDLYLSGDTYLSNGSDLKFKDSGGTSRDILTFDSSNNIVYAPAGAGVNNHIWKRNGSEKMRLDTAGNLLVGTTTANGNGITLNNEDYIYARRAGGTTAFFDRYSTDGDVVGFRKSGSQVGSITVTGSATTYNTSSDQRLKDNIVDAPSASDDIDSIQVRSFDWKADGSHQKYGMIAQELQTVAPEAVTEGETEDDMMGVDYSKLVPMLVKEIQSLRARVAQLEGEN